MDFKEYYTERKRRRLSTHIFLSTAFLVLAFAGLSFGYRFYNTPPHTFPLLTDIVIDEGLTVSAITEKLKAQNVVRSSLYLYMILLYEYKEVYVQAGTYSFEMPLSTREVAEAITSGEHRSPLVSITLPEGFKASDIDTYLADALGTLDTALFLPYEGYLFPDTYFISTSTTLDELRLLLTNTSASRLSAYTEAITASGFTENEVIILASIIEREAKDNVSKRMVSGILQNRLAAEMPLQVDAVFNYILGKTSSELTLDDLAIESPYNTYTNTGLPPTPIANPGIESIEAVLYPEKSDYLYYLTAPDGTFHYAKTFEEHKINKARYLR
ncbi:endolytic transglycosylase MltG [Candidatus Kaiserbacteria bacterium]|nr:MAG: endolytic transglycosylase MltG [Candidatus Kaiserbacteria bacterium]